MTDNQSIETTAHSVCLPVICFVAAFCLIAFGLHMFGFRIGSPVSFAGIAALTCAVTILSRNFST